MVGMLYENKADLAVGIFSITYSRYNVVDPAAVFDFEEIALVSARPTTAPRWQSVFEAFNIETWILTLFSLCLTGVVFYFTKEI